MKTIIKEQYQFVFINFVNPQDYNLDLEIINKQILFEEKVKRFSYIINNPIIEYFGSLFFLFLIPLIPLYFFGVPLTICGIVGYFIERLNYEIHPAFAIFGIYLSIYIWISIIDSNKIFFNKFSINLDNLSFDKIARNFALLLLFFINPSKYKYYKHYESSFNKFVNELKLKANERLDNQNNLINGLRWLYDKSIPFMRESHMSIKNFETEFNSIKEINTAFQLGLSDIDKSTFNSKVKNSDWWKMEENIQETKTRLEDEIIKREKEEIIRKEKALEDEKIRNEKRLIALAEYEKKREEQNKINETNRLQIFKEAEEKIRELEIALRNQREARNQQNEEEKFQKYLKKQSEKTNNALKPKTKINKQGIKVNKVISPDKLKQIIDQKIKIGELGEVLIYNLLKERLKGTIYQTYIEKFIHESKEKGDGSGYDILAYNENAELIYVEVKTTTASYAGAGASFSKNEIQFASLHDANYVLFLVYNLNPETGEFAHEETQGFSNVKEQLNFQPISYKLKIKDNLSNKNNQLNL